MFALSSPTTAPGATDAATNSFVSSVAPSCVSFDDAFHGASCGSGTWRSIESLAVTSTLHAMQRTSCPVFAKRVAKKIEMPIADLARFTRIDHIDHINHIGGGLRRFEELAERMSHS